MEIETASPPGPGAKITATHPIVPDLLGSLLESERVGGGALNQSLRFAEQVGQAGRGVDACLLDTSDPCAAVREVCADRGIILFTLGRHNCPLNIVSNYESDKLNVRSPIVSSGHALDDSSRFQIASVGGEADVVACISPKDAGVAQELFCTSSGAVKYLQPTGSLDPESTRSLVRRCHGLACNAKELGKLAQQFGMQTSLIDEAAPGAAEAAVAILVALYREHDLGLQASSITLGAAGCAVVDFEQHRAHAIEIQTSSSVQTTSGAGDFWNASWMFCREVGRLPEPYAAAEATRRVARGLGLRKATFAVKFRELSLPDSPSPLHPQSVLV